MKINKLFYSLLSGTISLSAFAGVTSENWSLKWRKDNGSGKIQGKIVKSGKYALETSTATKKSKSIFLRAEKIPVEPGKKYILNGYVKSATSKPSDSRIMMQYLDKSGKYKGSSHGIYAGGHHDWKFFKRTVKIPAGIYYVRLAAGNYLAPGRSWFDNIKLAPAENPKKVLAEDGFENSLESNDNVWRIPIKLRSQKSRAVVDINALRSNADLIHYTGRDSLKNLSLTCDYQVVKPGKCYLSSNYGTCYWYMFNLKTLAISLVWSDEKLDLTSKGNKQTIIPFQSRYTRYFDEISKGPGCIRGHHYFRIYSPAGKPLGSSQSANALIHPEASVFGKRQTQLSKSHRKSLYTLADLKNFTLMIDSLQVNWQPNGKFAFKIRVKDGENDIFDLNKVTSLNVLADGKKISVVQRFAPYDIPTGWFVGKFSSKAPETLNIAATVTAVTPQGNKTEKVAAQFSKNSNYQAFALKPWSNKTKEPASEVRMLFLSPQSILPQEPKKGKKQIKDIVNKARKANLNIMCPFAMGNRAWANYDTENQYFRRVFKKYDPIAIFREECTKAGLELHAIVCVLPEGAEKLLGILKKHPDWAMRAGGRKKGWLDPAVPEVKAYRLKDITRLVKKYKLDGISLDYARLSTGPSDRGAEIYKKKFGQDPRNFKYGSPDYIKWYRWTSNHLTDLVGQIHRELKKINPQIKISAYIQGDKYSGKNKWEGDHQDYLTWMSKGYLDIICPTAYIYDMLRFRAWCKRQIDVCRKANPKILCAPTIGVISSHGVLNNSDELLEQVNILRQLGSDGASYFRWAGLKKWLKELEEGCYPRPAQVPTEK
jgi:uncharacterized lipoprotein YddW (UPF0748 family)